MKKWSFDSWNIDGLPNVYGEFRLQSFATPKPKTVAGYQEKRLISNKNVCFIDFSGILNLSFSCGQTWQAGRTRRLSYPRLSRGKRTKFIHTIIHSHKGNSRSKFSVQLNVCFNYRSLKNSKSSIQRKPVYKRQQHKFNLLKRTAKNNV
jgi:hypothetical protein